MENLNDYQNLTNYYDFTNCQVEDESMDTNNFSIKSMSQMLFNIPINKLCVGSISLITDVESMQTVDIFCILLEMFLRKKSIVVDYTFFSLPFGTRYGYDILNENSTIYTDTNICQFENTISPYFTACGFDIIIKKFEIINIDEFLETEKELHYCKIVPKNQNQNINYVNEWNINDNLLILNNKFICDNQMLLTNFSSYFITQHENLTSMHIDTCVYIISFKGAY